MYVCKGLVVFFLLSVCCCCCACSFTMTRMSLVGTSMKCGRRLVSQKYNYQRYASSSSSSSLLFFCFFFLLTSSTTSFLSVYLFLVSQVCFSLGCLRWSSYRNLDLLSSWTIRIIHFFSEATRGRQSISLVAWYSLESIIHSSTWLTLRSSSSLSFSL